MLRLVMIALSAALAVPAIALAEGKLSFEDTIAPGKSSSLTFNVRQGPTFRVSLRVPAQGRARLSLLGKAVPRGVLIDTNTYECEAARGSRHCRLEYDPLPAGVYTWRINWNGQKAALVELRLRW